MPLPIWTFADKGTLNAKGHWTCSRPHQHAWVWPKDRPRTRLGRWSDIFSGKGPDIFVTSNANRAAHAGDGPTRARWSGFPADDDPDAMIADANAWRGGMPWTQAREDQRFFDFSARRYRRAPFDGMWTDARYLPGEGGGLPSFVTRWPRTHERIAIRGDPANPKPYDPRNWGSNGALYGRGGRGGEWDPVVDGFPPY